jgi:type I restriction enzyme, S subunit
MIPLGELVEINPPATGSRPEGPLSVIALPDVDLLSGTAHPRTVASLEEAGSARRQAQPGDVVFARISPSMENGKVAIVPEVETNDIVVSGELLVLRPRPGIDPGLIWAFLRQAPIREELKTFMTGSSGHQRLNADVLFRVQVPELPPETWERARAILDHFDAAARLSLQMQELAERLPGAAAELLSQGRPRDRLGELDVDFHYGTSERSAPEGMTPVLRIPNVVTGRITDDDLRFVNLKSDRRIDFLQPQDLLMVRTNGNIERLGSVAVYEAHPDPATYASYLIRIRSREADPDFLWAWLQSAEARSRLIGQTRTTAGQYNVSVAMLRNLPVPNLDGDSQMAIAAVARHARRLAAASREQRRLLEISVANHLASVFQGGILSREKARAAEATATAKAAPVDFLPRVFEAASARQKRLWQEVQQRDDAFGLAGLGSESEFASLQHTLAVLEQLGVLIRDESEETFRWRRPLPDLELDVELEE